MGEAGCLSLSPDLHTVLDPSAGGLIRHFLEDAQQHAFFVEPMAVRCSGYLVRDLTNEAGELIEVMGSGDQRPFDGSMEEGFDDFLIITVVALQ